MSHNTDFLRLLSPVFIRPKCRTIRMHPISQMLNLLFKEKLSSLTQHSPKLSMKENTPQSTEEEVILSLKKLCLMMEYFGWTKPMENLLVAQAQIARIQEETELALPSHEEKRIAPKLCLPFYVVRNQ